MKKILTILLLSMVVLFGVNTAQAQSMHTTQALQDGAVYGNQFQGKTLWFAYNVEGFPDVYLASAVRLNEHWGITVGHAFQNGSYNYYNFHVGDGSNYYSNPGNVRTVTEWYTHPTWNGTWDGTAVDLAVFRWNEALPGQDVVMGDLSVGEVITYVGFGKKATPPTGYIPPTDRQRRAIDMTIASFGASYASTDYARGLFFPPGPNYLTMGGNCTSGNSGSAGFNAAGELVAIASYAVGPTGYGSSTSGVRVALFQDWINGYVLPPPTPTPTATATATATSTPRITPKISTGVTTSAHVRAFRVCTETGPC